MGSIDVRYDNKNPAELYPSTTWELITSGKYIQSGNTPLSTGGSNSVVISKVNLPNVKLKVESHSHTQPEHVHKYTALKSGRVEFAGHDWAQSGTWNTEPAGGENVSTASPLTESLGSGTALTIQPAYITLKFWKRLT